MYQPAHLDSFLRLLISHLGAVLTQGERLIEGQSRETRMDLLLDAIENGKDTAFYQENIDQQRDAEGLFVLQMNQTREWVDRLGQLDPEVERQTDEFLATTFAVENLLENGSCRNKAYPLKFSINRSKNEAGLHNGLSGQVDIDLMMGAIFELLGRLEEQYDLMEELFEVRQVVNGLPFGRKYKANQSARIIPIFTSIKQGVQQDNERGSQ